MAAPSTTTRQTPGGIALERGFPCTIAFERDPDVSFWEKNITPPALDGGDAIETQTMHNLVYRTKAPRGLITVDDISLTVAYDPDVYNQIKNNLINRNGSITLEWADGTTCSFWGYLQKFEPGEMNEEDQPEADITIVVTNWDHNNNVEAGPVWTSVAGT